MAYSALSQIKQNNKWLGRNKKSNPLLPCNLKMGAIDHKALLGAVTEQYTAFLRGKKCMYNISMSYIRIKYLSIND